MQLLGARTTREKENLMAEIFIYTRTLEILVLMLVGAFLFWLGYKLFMVNLADKADLDAQYGKLKLKLVGASPGIFFALFGSVLISITMGKMARYEELVGQTPKGSVVKRIIEKTAEGRKEVKNFDDLVQAYNNAQKLHVAGHLPEAQRQYLAILHAIPELEKITNNLADLSNKQDKREDALVYANFGKIVFPNSQLIETTIQEINR
jgi:hypothetical protein